MGARMGQFTGPQSEYGAPVNTIHPPDNSVTPGAAASSPPPPSGLPPAPVGVDTGAGPVGGPNDPTAPFGPGPAIGGYANVSFPTAPGDSAPRIPLNLGQPTYANGFGGVQQTPYAPYSQQNPPPAQGMTDAQIRKALGF